MTVVDALRLSFGTFTGIKVTAPKRVDVQVIRIALFLSFIPTLVVSVAAWLAGYLAFRLTHAPLVSAVIVVGAEIALTSGFHIDGLMDAADGVAALAKTGRDRALEIMRTGDSGPAAFVTGFLVLSLQVALLSIAFTRHSTVSWIICALLARFSVVSSCRKTTIPARPDGLGNPFIGAINYRWLTLSTATNLMIVGILGAGRFSWLLLVAVLIAIVFGEFLKSRFEKQFGGLTGDMLGSILEKVRTISLLILVFTN